ncbi:hypothetical protein SAMN04488032_10230 [Pacificibacter marinus]|uniref:Uncharacterized protein n=1 Tax=Pacificibacter marinus TaxID=658057 RepID=A0A1Y5RYM2_9RHOB|nr:hypothetical protein SAMN04488032_10230 [Pacificibacter marinus]SLN27472.1 hypothetical protein PAM7971_01058 [Pacificibacter marinus]
MKMRDYERRIPVQILRTREANQQPLPRKRDNDNNANVVERADHVSNGFKTDVVRGSNLQVYLLGHRLGQPVRAKQYPER